MRSKTLARPYAQAAFDYAKEHGVIAAWQDALCTWSTLANNPEIKQVANASQISSDTFEDLVASFVNAKQGDPLRNFLKTVIEHDRFFVMPDICEGFIALCNANNALLPASVTSAIALTDGEKADITKKLEANTKQKVTLTCAVDPALLGGFVIRYGDKVIDASLKYRLSALAHSLN